MINCRSVDFRMEAPMLDLELLRSFVAVVEAGGFTRAAERVHRTQSTVSQQIRRLEEDVGQVLLHRDGKDVRPTEAGERLPASAGPARSRRWKAPAAPGTCPIRHRASPASRPRSPRAWG